MTEDDLIAFVSALPGVVTQTAAPGDGSPEIAWGTTFFYYDPTGETPASQRFPFATILVKDYEGFDEASRLGRPGVFRLNVSVGRERYEELLGHRPSAFDGHRDSYDYAVLDEVIPHPLYGQQAWVAILNPDAAAGLARQLITDSHSRASSR